MARITADGIQGLIGNTVFYTVRGKAYARSKARVKAKKKNQPVNPLNTIFGTVSKHGSSMVKTMSTSFLFPFNRDVYNQARGWMRNLYAEHVNEETWELSARHSGMCQLNAEIDIRNFLKADITVIDSGNGLINVMLPALNPKKSFKAPLRTTKVNVKAISLTSPFKGVEKDCKMTSHQLTFNYANEEYGERTLQLETNGNTGDVAVLAIAFEYEIGETGYLRDIRWLPAAMIAMGKLK